MTCCQLTPLVYPKDMVYVTRFWDKLLRYKQAATLNTIKAIPIQVDINNIQLKDVLNWAMGKNLNGSVILNGLFNSTSNLGLSTINQKNLTSIILNYFNDSDVDITDKLLDDMATQISINYKGENKDVYYKVVKVNDRITKKGKLVNKKYNIRRQKVTKTQNSGGPESVMNDTIVSIFTSIESGKRVLFF